MKRYLLKILALLISFNLFSQDYINIEGIITDSKNNTLELVNVYEINSGKGTTTDSIGYYNLKVPASKKNNLNKEDTLILRFSSLSYKTEYFFIQNPEENITVNKVLKNFSQNLDQIVVKSIKKQTNFFEKVDKNKIRMMPDPNGGSIESIIFTYAGVSSTNELSSQYSVRGGSYDENLVYINGTEIYKPLLVRSGKQEGLSAINPEMVRSVNFSAGGFDVKYGDKMSSVLDIKYKKPNKNEASFSSSLLGANLYVGRTSKNKKFTYLNGIRYKTNKYLLGTLDENGEYSPSFFDYQNYSSYSISKNTEINILINISRNKYQFEPEDRETTFGTYGDLNRLKVYFDGKEDDGFNTYFSTLSLNHKINNKLNFQFQASAFDSEENERYDISGEYWLSKSSAQKQSNKNEEIIGVGNYHEHARNELSAKVINLNHKASYTLNKNKFEWGLSYNRENISDNIKEWQIRDSAGYSLPAQKDNINMIYSNKSNLNLNSNRYSSYFQDTWKDYLWNGLFSISGGIRFSYWSFNNELITSPRISSYYIPNWNKNFTFRLSTGIYYQAPFYKEIRKNIKDGFNSYMTLNKNIKSPKSYQILAGTDYNFKWNDRLYKFTAESYYKKIENLIPYSVDNVRIIYLGENLGDAFTTGLDLKLFGELVEGTDSWISLSLMKSKEKAKLNATGQSYEVSRPNEQRYNFSMFFQDYFPEHPQFIMSLKFIWADGLPFGFSTTDRSSATLRMPAYRRADIGFNYVCNKKNNKFMNNKPFTIFKNLFFGINCFNLLNIENVNSYYWISDINDAQWAVPNYLTSRLLDFKITAEL